ncbi:PilZ domain-containing protein [Brevundimonas subvibrioides]|uniref:PilZ domain-containing protein n=1 Tax=Brevundimonas subvibrioides TaxID=74313 RepID=UPI0022B30AB4|nr:PilZ domain-containing protein [Brevundimonas subvibrioides]
MYRFQDRRTQARSPGNTSGVVIAEGRELSCLIADMSDGGIRIRLDRAMALPDTVIVVDITRATAFEATVAWQKGVEVGLKVGQGTNVRGLVPSRLAQARQAWVRASAL